LPANQGLGSDDDERLSPFEQARQERHGETGGVIRAVRFPFSLLIEGELFPEKQIFRSERGARTKMRKSEASEVAENGKPKVQGSEVPS
jgi:hypothetical protein